MTYFNLSDEERDWRNHTEWEMERQYLRLEALADAEQHYCETSGDCCCPTEPSSRYSPGGIITYTDCCPEHGIEADEA